MSRGGRFVQSTVVSTPPSTRTADPFVADAAGLARNVTMFAISLGSMNRPNNDVGFVLIIAAFIASVEIDCISASVQNQCCPRHDAESL